MLRRVSLATKLSLSFGILVAICAVTGAVAWWAMRGVSTTAELDRAANTCLDRLNTCAMARRDFALRGFQKEDNEGQDAADRWRAGYGALMTDLRGLQADGRLDRDKRALVEAAVEKASAYLTGFDELAKARATRDEAFASWRKVGWSVTEDVEKAVANVITPARSAALEKQDQAQLSRWTEIGHRLDNDVIQPFLVLRVTAVYLLATNRDEQWNAYQQQLQKVKDGTSTWATLVSGETLLEEFARNMQGYLQKYEEAGNSYYAGMLSDRQANTAMAATAGGIVDQMKQLTASLGKDMAVITARTSTMTGAMAACGAVLGVVLAAIATRSVVRPLRNTFRGLRSCSTAELDETASTFNRIIDSMTEGVSQVNDAAAQVSTAAQQLAEGASEQASSLEETSSALEEMAAMARNNAANSKAANELATESHTAAADGEKTMVGINEASDKISKIIKVIEEIAFQTNLLALNAAVEAARAGEHGKGFAVVAEEVRNLAQRAAGAARETTSLIEDSVNKARAGKQAIQTIVAGVAKVTELINGISRASEEQAQGVEQVNTAVSQMDKVTQQNAAGAEESASAAEELTAQAAATKGFVDELVVLVRGAEAGSRYTPQAGFGPAPTVARNRPAVQATHPGKQAKPGTFSPKNAERPGVGGAEPRPAADESGGDLSAF